METDTDAATAPDPVVDLLHRPVTDLRVSVTDRCNLRCGYCMPRELFGADHAFLPRAELLSFEELERLAGVFAELGVRKVRLTGGEPLLRRDLPELVAGLRAIDALDDLALTTNGTLLPQHAPALSAAGLDRVTVSLDALDDAVFKRIGDTVLPVTSVLDGVAAAQEAGLRVKVNTVLQRGANEDQIEPLAGWAREAGVVLRFIEFMDVGTSNGWDRSRVVPATEVVDRLAQRWALEPVEPTRPGEVAERYRYLDGGGEVGVIASVTRPFCRTCVRARLSAIGELFTCLFAASGHDLRAVLRGGADDATVRAAIVEIWRGRADRASQLRSAEGLSGPRVEMSYIGG
ncbi:MAG: GTP 3',8-cyclase MoaA [Nitriliruptoraceae bacterium]